MNNWNPDHCICLSKALNLPRRWYQQETGLCNLFLASQEPEHTLEKLIIDKIVSSGSTIALHQIELLKKCKPSRLKMVDIARHQPDPYGFGKALGLNEETLENFRWKSQNCVIHTLENDHGYLNVMATLRFIEMLSPDFMAYEQTKSKPRYDKTFDDFWALKNPLLEWHDPSKTFDTDIDYASIQPVKKLERILTCFRNDPTKLGSIVRGWIASNPNIDLAPPFSKESYSDIQDKSFLEIVESYTAHKEFPLSTLFFVLRYLPHYSEEQWKDAAPWIASQIQKTQCKNLDPPSEIAYIAPKERLHFLLEQPCVAHAIARRIAENGDLFGNESNVRKVPIWRWVLDPNGEKTPLELADTILKNANTTLTMSDIVERHAVLKSLNPEWRIQDTYKMLIVHANNAPAQNLDFMSLDDNATKAC